MFLLLFLLSSLLESFYTILLLFAGLFFAAVFLIFLAMQPVDPSATGSKKERRLKALRNHVAKSGARDIYVERIGTEGTYLEHFVIRYYDAENSWQTRHVIRRQIPTQQELHEMQDRYYWDDPVVAYEREVSAEISQSKQELINDLDIEIHELRQAINLTKNNKSQANSQLGS